MNSDTSWRILRHRSLLGPSAGWFELVSPVAAVGVDAVFAEDLAGLEPDDGDGGFVGDREDAFAGVTTPDAEVVYASGVADADVAVAVDAVVAQSAVLGEPSGGG